MTHVIRAGVLADAPAIAEIQVRGWQAAYTALVPRAYLDSLSIDQRRRFWEAHLAALPPGVRSWVAVERGTVVGFCTTGASRDTDGGADTGEVQAIYVAPAIVGTGVGRALLAHAVDDLATRFNTATLWVLDGNDRAIRSYEIAGWHRDGAVKDDVRHGFTLHEIRMRIGLPS